MDIELNMMQGIAALNRQRGGVETAEAYLKSVQLDHIAPDDTETWFKIKDSADRLADAYRMAQAAKTGIAELTREFWTHDPAGQLLSKFYVWLYGDRLITTKEAIFTIAPDLDRSKRPDQRYWVMISNNATSIRDPQTKRPMLNRYWKDGSVRFLLDEVLELKRRKESRAAHEATDKEPTNAKIYSGFIDPAGNPVTIHNLTKFCRDNELDRQPMHLLMKGKYGAGVYKGWTYRKNGEDSRPDSDQPVAHIYIG